MPEITLDLTFVVLMVATSLASAFLAIYGLGWVLQRQNREEKQVTLGSLRDPGMAALLPPPAQEIAVEDLRVADMERNFSELARLREVVDHSPMLVWRQQESGQIMWSNRAYTNIAERVFPGQTDAHVAALFRPRDDGRTAGRCSLHIADQPKPLWFEQYSYPLNNEETLHFALHADPVVRAEEALRNFIQTLTKTFAHLPIGLAIFDRNRQLALFNPALSDLTDLGPEWLTARPSLRDFLDRLRENRHLPEPKDYNSWRDRIAALERAAVDGTYEEHWPLPTGQTYKVTGRPHPEGAVAFLFEDITASISLQRQFRSEMEICQSVIDSLREAIAVFSADGDLVLSNDAFATLWGIDPREMLARMSLDEAIEFWKNACRPSPVWQELRAFSDYRQSRTSKSGAVRLSSGSGLMVEFETLSRGAILCRFSGPACAPQDADKKLDQMA
ncbi:MAG: PAS domain-containing protein [Alphaproteobacteria bacterium]|nr:PAS domain-containing protein [Alphaproteobacteria bacterium]